MSAVQKVITTVRKQTLKQSWRLQEYNVVQEVMNQVFTLSSLLSYVLSLILEYKVEINTIKSNRVPTIFTKKQIGNIFQTAMTAYPELVIPLDARDERLDVLHRYMDILQTDEHYTYTLRVPLFKKHPYEIIQLASLPIKS